MAVRGDIPSKCLDALKFTCYSADEIRKLSVKEVTNPRSLDFLLNPTENGLYDPVFGPPTRLDDCKTCGLGSAGCPGHLGHIELPLPLYQPAFFKTLLNLLKGSCLKCHRILINRRRLLLLLYKILALNHGLYQLVNNLDEKFQMSSLEESESDDATQPDMIDDELKKMYFDAMQEKCKDSQDSTTFSKNATELRRSLVNDFNKLSSSKKKCEMCGTKRPSIRSEQNCKIFLVNSKDKTIETTQRYMTPTVAREHMSKLWDNDQAIIECAFGAFHDASLGNKMSPDTAATFSSDVAENSESLSKKRSSAMDVLFLTVLSVPPSRYRPVMLVNGKQFENPQTSIYSKILVDCIILRTLMSNLHENEVMTEIDATEGAASGKTNMWNKDTDNIKISDKFADMLVMIPGKTKAEKLENCWDRLQKHVNSIYDSESAGMTGTGEHCPGIKQKLEKKDGLFRKHMMGKRVNYAARSVISPDPYIATHEIGVPLCFASKLTYPTPVTPWNVKKLRQCVINGPNGYPGATMVIQEDGCTTLLKADNPTQRQAIAKQLNAPQKDRKKRKQGLRGIKTVIRHMQNGDVMLINRQPTLHKGSIMAHKVRVLPGEKTLRLHYANCKSYNADFDGDEMNAHFPQSELCRAEAFNLMSTNSQYLTCKDGKPLSGLIQDHMVAGVNISIRGRYFTQEQYQQLSYNALMHIQRKIKLLPPTILKPQRLWTGKQVFSTILLNITPTGSALLYLEGSSKICTSDWESRRSRATDIGYMEMCESEVIVRGSQLLCGVLDKNHYGASEYGLVHAMYELYGCEISGELLTCLARLFTAFLQQYSGFTLGVEDILVTEPADEGRQNVIESTLENGQKDLATTLAVQDAEDVDEITSKIQDAHISKITGGEDGLAAVDHVMKRASNDVNDQIARLCTGSGLNKTFPKNNLQLMVISGAKGGAVNCMQISCLLGQIELEGRRPPLMVSGRSVPSFLPYDLTLRAGGFISQRFLTGIRPQEYFYHCMAGREGLVDTAVKTSRSGYLQRCLIKHLEGLVLGYDLTVRDSDGSIQQFLYGEDGLETAKQSYLSLKQHKFLVENFAAESKLLPTMETVESAGIDTNKTEKMWRKNGRRMKRKRKAEKKMWRDKGEHVDKRKSPFIEYMWENRGLTKAQALSGWSSMEQDQKNVLKEKLEIFSDTPPICCVLRPDLNLGSMSEKFRTELDKYLEENPDNLPTKQKKKNKLPTLDRVKAMLSLKYQKSLTQPGESVGLMAAQSIGEPSTQMTLNTFHFAGRGEMNVTLGIPRLREILMTAAKRIKTPQVIVPVTHGQDIEAEKLQKNLTCVRLQQVLHKVNVQEHLDVDSSTTGHRSRRCMITIKLLPERQFKKDLALTRKAVLTHIEKVFLEKLLVTINHQLKLRQDEEIVFSQRAARGMNPGQVENNQDDDDLETEPVEDEAGGDQDEEDDEAFDQDDAKMGKNREDFEEEEEEETEERDNENDVEDISKIEPLEPDAPADELQKQLDKVFSCDYQARIAKVKQMGVNQICISDYDFDQEKNGWCKVVIDMPLKTAQANIVSLVEQEARSSYVRYVKGITRCVIQTNQKKPDEIKFATEGINFYKLFEHPEILDLSKLQCNCVHSVETTYGIEAAVRVIEREVANVFAVYGIQVNRRHLSLVADYMCFSGKYKAFNRPGLESCTSPLQQMTFESTMTFLKDAALTARWDYLQSPSARIVAGQVVKSGTGCFSVRIPLNGHKVAA